MTAEVGGYDSTYVPALAAAEDRHFWFRARNAVIRAVVSNIEATLSPGYRVLEVGCGTGNTLRVLDAVCRRGTVLGMDAQREGLAYARPRVSCQVVQGDLRHAPFAPSVRFDMVGMFDVLEHIPDDVDALAAVRECVSPHGALVLTVPASPALWSAFDVAARHCRRYTARHLGASLAAAGFKVEYMTPFMAGLYPIAWLQRRGKRPRAGGRHSTDPILADLRIVPVVNGALAWLLAQEAPLVAARFRLPLGTSLLAIASPRRDGL